MAATRRQFNWSNVTFTPAGGTAQVFSGVTAGSIDPGGSLATFSGDNDRYPTLVVNDMNAPTANFTVADIGTIQGIPAGTTGTLSATHLDAKAAVGGNIVYTLANAVVANTPSTGAHRQFGSGTISFQAYSSDGLTNPLSFTRS